MKNDLIYYLLITLSIIVNSCTEGFKEEYLKISIALAEVTANTTPTTDTTPDYTFSSTKSGALTYGGSCSSSTTSAISGNNTITLNTLSVGTYADCTITVSKTMTTNKSETTLSGSLTITSFIVSENTTSLSAPENLSASGANDTITLTWNSVSGATSYTLYWNNVPGIDSSDTAITSITNDNYTDSNKETNYVLDFDGTNDYVSIPNNPFSNKNTFTIQAWLRPLAVNDNNYHGFLGMQDSGGLCNVNGGRKPSLYVDKDGNLHYYSCKGNQRFTGTISDGSNKFFTASEWVHVVWTNDASNYKFYKNGNLVDNVTAPDTFNALDSSGYEIGRVDNYFNGQIDEVAIWDVALNAADVTSLYNSGNGLKASANSGNYDNFGDLVGYRKFNEGTGSTLTDNTSNSNNGTLTNMDSSDWVNGIDNWSIYYYKVAAVNSSGTGTLSSVASAIIDQRIQASEIFNGHTYALTSADMTWDDAKTAATALGGYLTTINTKAENDWLTTRFRIPRNSSPYSLWIGANDKASPTTWVWDNGTTSGDSGLTDDLSSNAT